MRVRAKGALHNLEGEAKEKRNDWSVGCKTFFLNTCTVDEETGWP